MLLPVFLVSSTIESNTGCIKVNYPFSKSRREYYTVHGHTASNLYLLCLIICTTIRLFDAIEKLKTKECNKAVIMLTANA